MFVKGSDANGTTLRKLPLPWVHFSTQQAAPRLSRSRRNSAFVPLLPLGEGTGMRALGYVLLVQGLR